MKISFDSKRFVTFFELIHSQSSLPIIESHIFTPNSTEAWLLLSLIAKKMKSKNPDAIVQALMQSIQRDMVCVSYSLLLISLLKSFQNLSVQLPNHPSSHSRSHQLLDSPLQSSRLKQNLFHSLRLTQIWQFQSNTHHIHLRRLPLHQDICQIWHGLDTVFKYNFQNISHESP